MARASTSKAPAQRGSCRAPCRCRLHPDRGRSPSGQPPSRRPGKGLHCCHPSSLTVGSVTTSCTPVFLRRVYSTLQLKKIKETTLLDFIF